MTQSTIGDVGRLQHHQRHRATRIAARIFSQALALLVIASLAMSLGGCKADTSPGAGRGDWYPAPMNDPQISVLAPDLREAIVFQSATITRDDERPMTVQTPVRNLHERQYLIEYRYLFFDDAGRQLSPVMGWTFANLDPKQVVRLEGKALTLNATDYRLEVRWSR